MRPVEILLVVANLVTFLLLVVPLPGGVRWMRHGAPIALLVAGAQLLLEGPRWQLVPAYALSGLFSLVWLLRTIKPAGWRVGRPWIRRLAAGLGVGLGAVVLAVSIALPIIFPVFSFPQPTGPYEIGRLTYHWVDADRPEILTADPGDHRELMVDIWYPAKGDPSAPHAPYMPDAHAVAPALGDLFGLPGFALGHLEYVTTHAIASAPVAGDQPSYPVLIYMEGGIGYRQMNTFQVEELVSHGYIVVAIDQPYAADMVVFPDGRQAAYDDRFDAPHRRPGYDPNSPACASAASADRSCARGAFLDDHIPYLAQDALFTLDQLTALNQADPNGILTGRLDLQRAGLFGHSLGALVGGEACLREPRLRACLLEDAYMATDVVRAGLQQPTMFITRDAETIRLERRRSGGWPEANLVETLSTMRAVYESLPGDGYYVQVPGMFHLDMNDVPLLSPLASRLGFSGPIGGQRAHKIVNAYSLAFFDRHLKGEPAALLDGPAAQYPEVTLETRRPSSAR